MKILSPGTIARILDYAQTTTDQEMFIQLEQDALPGQGTGFRFLLYLSDSQLSLRVLMSPELQSLLPKGATDCCPRQRDANNTKKWRRAASSEDLTTTWQAYECVPALTRLSVTNVLKEGDLAKLSRQFAPDDHTFAVRWASKGLTDIFGSTFPELSQYRYELIPQ